jgi:hypothetical protein
MHSIPTPSARTRGVALAMILFVVGVVSAAAAPPPNDRCDTAQVIPSSGPFPHVTQQVDLKDATPDVVPFPPPSTSFDTNITRSVWYQFTPAQSGLYTFSTGFDTDTTFRDTSMILYTGADCTNFAIHSFNEDSGSLRAAISTNLLAGANYYLVVWVGRTEEVGAGGPPLELGVRVTQPAVPANDTCATPLVIPFAPYTTTNFDTTLATTTLNVTPPCVTNVGTVPSRDLWFQFTPTNSTSYIFSTASNTRTLVDDTSIALYTLPAGCQFPAQIACNDNGFGRAVLAQALTAGTTYYLAVWDNAPAYIPGETEVQLRVSPATAPDAETLPATNIQSANVTLTGRFNPNGAQGRYWFEWGPTPSLGSTSQIKIMLSGTADIHTNLVITGHAPNTLYYYRLVATNNLGRTDGALRTFRWDTTRPTLDTNTLVRVGNTTYFEFIGATNHAYLVQTSTNLSDWVSLAPSVGTNPPVYQVLHVPTNAPRQLFYRVLLP